MSEESKAVYDMKLHEIITVGQCQIRRVPGGWIYSIYSQDVSGGYSTSSCFVPFDNEYQGGLK